MRQNSPSSGGWKSLAFTAPDEGEFCLTEILGNKIITLLSCPISLTIGFLFYSTLLILIYTKIRLHLATVCPSGPCIELPYQLGRKFSLSPQTSVGVVRREKARMLPASSCVVIVLSRPSVLDDMEGSVERPCK